MRFKKKRGDFSVLNWEGQPQVAVGLQSQEQVKTIEIKDLFARPYQNYIKVKVLQYKNT